MAHAQTTNRSPALLITVVLVALVLIGAVIGGLGTVGAVRATTDASGTVQYVGPNTAQVPASSSAMLGEPGYNPNR